MTVQTITVAATAILFFTLGFTVARIFGCGQCRAVHDQEATLIKRLLGDRELEPIKRHKIRRHRPYTAGEALALVDYNKALLTEERWKEIEYQARRWNASRFQPGREPFAVETRPAGAHSWAGTS